MTRSVRFAPRRLLAAVSVFAALACLVGTPAAHAEVVDYDPTVDPVPEILEPDEFALLERATLPGFVYMMSGPSPSAAYVLAYAAEQIGLIDLQTGALVPLDPAAMGMYQATEDRWLDEDTLGRIAFTIDESDPEAPPVVTFYRMTIEAADGTAGTEPFDAEALGGSLVSAGPRLERFLVTSVAEGAPPSRRVEIGPTFDGDADVPEGLPGLVGARPFGPLELQQAETTLALVDADGGNRREILRLPADSGIANVTWSEDGSRVAILTRTMPGWESARPRGDDPPIPGTPNLGSINVQEALGLLPPAENPLVTGSRLYAFDAASGESVQVFENEDLERGLLSGIVFSPSGRRAVLAIASRSELEGRPYPTYAYPSGMELVQLDLDLAVVGPIQGPGMDLLSVGGEFLDDDRFVSVTADEVDSRMHLHDLAAGTASPLLEEPGAVLQLLTSSGVAVYSHSDIGAPYELWAGTPDAAEPTFQPRAVTAFHQDASDLGADLRAEPVSWRTSDGETIAGVIVHHADQPYPPEEPGPLVVWQQGGPGGQMWRDYGSTVESPYSVLPHFGLPVLIANASGRSVKSRDFYSSMADADHFGQLDIAQIKEGVDALVRRRIVHPRRVGITGCSYGGYFTLQSLRAYPDTYAAGNAQCSLVDLTEEFTFGYTPFIAYLMGVSPTAAVGEYLRDAPYYGSADIRAKVLLFHGRDDFLPHQLIANIHDELVEGGVPATFLRVANEGHGFGMRESQLTAAQMQIRFFVENLVEADVGPAPLPAVYLPATYRNVAP